MHSRINILFHTFLLICAGIFFSGCATVYRGNDSWFGQDKLYHFTAGGVIGAGTTYTLLENGVDKNNAPVIGISVVFVIGSGKEYYDKNVKNTFWSWKDMTWNIIGGTTGSYLVIQNK